MSYVISTGEYSDYHVVAICDSKETADTVVAKLGVRDPNFAGFDTHFRVEEIPYIDSPEQVRYDLIYSVSIRVHVDDQGKPDDYYHEGAMTLLEYSFDGTEPHTYERPSVNESKPSGPESYKAYYDIRVADKDVARAWKIAREKYGKWLAEVSGL